MDGTVSEPVPAAVSGRTGMTEEEMEYLVGTYGDHLLRLCLLYLKDRALAEDALQDTFVRAWEKWDSFRGESREKTWLTRIAVNVCKNYLRSPWNRRRADVDSIQELLGGDGSLYEQREQHIDIVNEVLKLKDRYRIVILLYYYEEMSAKEISEFLHVNRSTVLSRLKRAREQLRERIGPVKGVFL